MAHIPEKIADGCVVQSLENKGLLIHQGKVRDSYKIIGPAGHKDARLIVASDRLSIFDFVLAAVVPYKGLCLTVLPHFWMTNTLKRFPNHLIPSPSRQNNHNFAVDICEGRHKDIPLERSLAVRNLKMLPYELIFRHHIGGSVWKEYTKSGTAAGQPLPAGLQKWAKLDEPVFTPSTKAENGHDENITAERFFAETVEIGRRAVAMLKEAYKEAYAFAQSKGILILDTKFEVGIDEDGDIVIADEVLTPDSSRFTTVQDFNNAISSGRDPVFYDKEPVREWGRSVETPFKDESGKPIVGINNLDPQNPLHLSFVDSIAVPSEVVVDANSRYLHIVEALTGATADAYRKKYFL